MVENVRGCSNESSDINESENNCIDNESNVEINVVDKSNESESHSNVVDKSNESQSQSNVGDKSNESQSQSNVVETNVVGKSNESQSNGSVESNVESENTAEGQSNVGNQRSESVVSAEGQSENNVVAGFGGEAPMDEEPPVVSDSSQGPSTLEVAEQYGERSFSGKLRKAVAKYRYNPQPKAPSRPQRACRAPKPPAGSS